jgi:hypothetical protein
MAFGINSFVENVINTGGVSKGAYFDVVFTPPRGLVGGYRTGLMSDMMFRCEGISMPGRTPTSSNVKYYGPQRKQYYGYDSNPVTASFIMSEDLSERDLFMAWQDIAVGAIRKDVTQSVLGGFNVGYYDDYVSNVIIRKYNEANKLVYSTILVQAFPTSVLESSVNWSDGDIMKLSVTFDYHYFVDKTTNTYDAEQRRNIYRNSRDRKNDFAIDPTEGLTPIQQAIRAQGPDTSGTF